MTRLTSFVLRHALIGGAAAVLFVALFLAADVGGLGSLVARSADGPLAAVVMTVFFAITFGSVQVGFALMLKDWDEDEIGRGGLRAATPPEAIPLPVRATIVGPGRRPRR